MSGTQISEGEVIRRLRLHIANVHGSQRSFAKSVKCSDAYVSAVLTGKTKLPAKWLHFVGVARLIDVRYFGTDS